MDTIDEILRKLPNLITPSGPAGLSEPSKLIAEFRARRGKDEITIKVFEYGPTVKINTRYHCIASTVDPEDDEVRTATGNPGYSPMEAVENVHWHNLDRRVERRL